jgi:hypothetical protein
MAASKLTLADRFWSKVLKTETCWLWQAQRNNKGYGCLAVYRSDKGRHWPTYAHRLSWTLTNGPIPDELNVLHRCDTPACVNPDHLFLGTQCDNMRDCVNKGRMPPSTSHAKLTEDQVRGIRIDTRPHHIIAAAYDLKRLAVWNIKHLKTWAWVEGPIHRGPRGGRPPRTSSRSS